MAVLISLIVISFAILRIGPGSALTGNSRPNRPGRGGSSAADNNSISRARENTVVLLYHKPAKVVTSHISEDSRSTVYEDVLSMKGYLPSPRQDLSIHPSDRMSKSFEEVTGIQSKLHAIGRLDADTTGLLLLTNDGGLVHHVTNRNAATHARTGTIAKTYRALIMGRHDEKSLSPLWVGVDIGAKYGGMTRPVDDLRILGHPNHKSTLVSLTISEGKNRQVRRMFHALGSGVMELKRTEIGKGLTLDGVEENTWRILSDDEVRDCLGWEIRNLTAEREYSSRIKKFPSKQPGSTRVRRRRR